MESEYNITLRGTLKIPSAIPFEWMRRKLGDTILEGFEVEIECRGVRPVILVERGEYEGRITEKKIEERRRKEAEQEGIPLQ